MRRRPRCSPALAGALGLATVAAVCTAVTLGAAPSASADPEPGTSTPSVARPGPGAEPARCPRLQEPERWYGDDAARITRAIDRRGRT